jgi:hypothetical protein
MSAAPVEVLPEALPVNRMVAVTVAVSPTEAVAVAELNVIELVRTAACELGPDRRPRLNAVTKPSEIRLKNVFVDIYFLSLVVYETFSHTAGKK